MSLPRETSPQLSAKLGGLDNGCQVPRWVRGWGNEQGLTCWWPPAFLVATPSCLSLCAGPSPWWPPSEGLSADNQGTDSERRRKKALRRQTGSLSSGAECQRQQQQARSPATEALHSQPEGRRGPALGAGEEGGQDGLFSAYRS